MLPEVRAAMDAAAEHFVDLEELMEAAGRRIAAKMGAEGALVTNGAAAGLCQVRRRPTHPRHARYARPSHASSSRYTPFRALTARSCLAPDHRRASDVLATGGVGSDRRDGRGSDGSATDDGRGHAE